MRSFAYFPALLIAVLAPASVRGQIGNIVVVSGASFQPGMPSVGGIGTIFCTGLTISGVVTAQGTPLPYTLAGVSVTINFEPAPLFAVADLGGYQQINFEVPHGATSSGPYGVLVAQGGAQSPLTAVSGASATGEFFRIEGTQLGVFQHASDYSLVTQENPATPGETIIGYATGILGLSSPSPDGQPAPLSPPQPLAQYWSCSTFFYLDRAGIVIDGFELLDAGPTCGDSTGQEPILFVGLTPGAVGLDQINLTLPDAQTLHYQSSGNNTMIIERQTCISVCSSTGCGCIGYSTSYSTAVLLPVR
jgi:uncharacterized protein (TIGR03437 family)